MSPGGPLRSNGIVEFSLPVLMAIIKASKCQFPNFVIGKLFGCESTDADGKSKLCVLSSITLPPRRTDSSSPYTKEPSDDAFISEYISQRPHSQALTEQTVVGFFQSCQQSDFKEPTFFQNLFAAQRRNINSILLAFDVTSENLSTLPFKVFRFNEAIVSNYLPEVDASDWTQKNGQTFVSSVFEELEVSITATVAQESFLLDAVKQDLPCRLAPLARLNFQRNSVSQSQDLIGDALENLSQDNERFRPQMDHTRRKSRNELPKEEPANGGLSLSSLLQQAVIADQAAFLEQDLIDSIKRLEMITKFQSKKFA